MPKHSKNLSEDKDFTDERIIDEEEDITEGMSIEQIMQAIRKLEELTGQDILPPGV